MAIAQVESPFSGARKVRAVFDAKPISSDGGALLLRQVDRRLGLLKSLSAALPDPRDPRYVEHTLLELLQQRVYGIALGYEDCNDATTLRRDPVLKTCCDRDPFSDRDLASQPTLSRLENEAGPKSCYLLARVILESYFVRHPKRPKRLIFDLDTTADPTHGQQEFAAFHAFYDEHIYLPLLIYDQDGDLVTAVLQPGKPQGVKGAVAVLRRVVERMRKQWPGVPILIRGDSGFASPDMYLACKQLDVDFLLGLAPNSRLQKTAAPLQEDAKRRFLRTGEKARLFSSTRYRARRRWSRSYRVLIKAEHQAIGSNLRFVVTTLPGRAQALYDACYVERAEACENSIKDLKNALKADRLSCHRFWANQFRLLLHSAAYVLMYELRRAARGTEFEDVQMDTLRLRLLKVGVQVASTARRVWFHLSSSYPWQAVWLLIARRLVGEPDG
jgi:DDE family transposase